ncbi:MAG TPA: metabolite traffic protein EboE [Pedobacter sp.]|jgi:hypothetical protein
MLTANGHLSYCSNIHAGESWKDHFEALKVNFPKIKNAISPNQAMGIGLRLSNIASLEIIQDDNLMEFKTWLQQEKAYVFTMNGFPYGGFHHTRVKDQVHAPDWTTIDRVAYAKRLLDVLLQLLPSGMDGGISTSPLTYRYWFNQSQEELLNARKTATLNILEVVIHLAKIKNETSTVLHLDIEPEPDGLLETGQEFIDWFENDLLVEGISVIAQTFNVSDMEAETIIKEHLRLCYDICHFAVGYESHQEVLTQLKSKGILVGKIQISAALKALVNSFADRNQLKEAFTGYNESTYLHQVVARKNNGSFIRYPDLPEALNDAENASVEEWRAHFHVPLFLEDLGILKTTQSDITELLNIHKQHPFTNHLEVETYTWEVLPDALKLPIHESIIRELDWVKNVLA